MEVGTEPALAHGGIVTPPANPGSPEYSPDLASESGQDKLSPRGCFPPSPLALLRRSPLRRPLRSTSPVAQPTPR